MSMMSRRSKDDLLNPKQSQKQMCALHEPQRVLHPGVGTMPNENSKVEKNVSMPGQKM